MGQVSLQCPVGELALSCFLIANLLYKSYVIGDGDDVQIVGLEFGRDAIEEGVDAKVKEDASKDAALLAALFGGEFFQLARLSV